MIMKKKKKENQHSIVSRGSRKDGGGALSRPS
jgi:hypothetical protein